MVHFFFSDKFAHANMYATIMETARDSTFRNPFVTTVDCDSGAPLSSINESKSLVAGRTIAAAAVAEGGNFNKLFSNVR